MNQPRPKLLVGFHNCSVVSSTLKGSIQSFNYLPLVSLHLFGFLIELLLAHWIELKTDYKQCPGSLQAESFSPQCFLPFWSQCQVKCLLKKKLLTSHKLMNRGLPEIRNQSVEFSCKLHAVLSLVQTQSHTLMPGINHAAAHNYHICMMKKTFVCSHISPLSLALLSSYHFWEYFLIKNTFLNKLWNLHQTQCFPLVPLGGAHSLQFWFWYKDGFNKHWWERHATGKKAYMNCPDLIAISGVLNQE